jgi:hypothetical protein
MKRGRSWPWERWHWRCLLSWEPLRKVELDGVGVEESGYQLDEMKDGMLNDLDRIKLYGCRLLCDAMV